jgi:hypothetical protein
MRFIENLRIGTKLAITSLLSVVMVVALIYAQMSGSDAVRQANEKAGNQNLLAMKGIEAKSSTRGMMIGVRDIRLASTRAQLLAAQEDVVNQYKAAGGFISEALKLSKSAENRERLEKMNQLADQYLNNAAKPIGAARGELLEIEAKQGADMKVDVGAGLAKLENEAVRLTKEVALPTAKELAEVSEKVVEFATGRGGTRRSVG